MICAGVPGKDSCNGDSGSPLLYQQQNGQEVQLGVVSFGPDICGLHLGVYAKLSHPVIRRFIREQVEDNQCRK